MRLACGRPDYSVEVICAPFIKGYPEGDEESFVTELNNILYCCGYGPLYYGNPFDWLFCSVIPANITEQVLLKYFVAFWQTKEVFEREGAERGGIKEYLPRSSKSLQS